MAGLDRNPSETIRLRALHQLAILDTPNEKLYDDVAFLVAGICNTPIAMISLIDEDRQWFKAVYGTSMKGCARDISFCTHTIEQSGVFVIPDALQDARFKDSPLVKGELRIRFYAGAPLITPQGHAIGALCVVDHKPRIATADQLEALKVLSRHVMTMIELRNIWRLSLPATG